MQLTLKANYASACTYFGHDFVNNREGARSQTYSAPIARWYWTVTHNMNGLADNLNMAAVTRAVNGTGASQATLQARFTDFKAVLNHYYGFVPSGVTCV
jgi:putative chitinase